MTQFLTERFPSPFLTPSADHVRALLDSLAEADITGGSSYDALIAVTALHARATLVTCDRRAVPTYRIVGVPVDVVT